MALLFAFAAAAQYIPPDRYGDEHKGADVLRQNMGQVFDTDGNQRSDIKGYFERTPVNVYLRDSSRVSFAFTSLHKDSLAKDTTYRVDLSFVGAKSVAPTFVVPTPGITNYYRGSTATEQVPAYRRGIYQGLKQGIDLHIYGSTSGPRLSFVLQAGANPDNLVLKFTGQDSLDIDWLGSLRAYVKGRWVELREATAYQVTALGAMVDVTWSPQWIHQDGSIYAKFNFGNYDNTLPLVFQVGYAGLGGGSTPEPRNMEWSTFIGGFGSDELTDVKLDEDNNPYACGQVWSPDFPVATGDAVFDPFLGQAAGVVNAVVMRFNHSNKQLVWGSYYGGGNGFITNHTAKTEARKLAIPLTGPIKQYVLTVGTTNCADFAATAESGTPFANALQSSYTSGFQRMWVGAFKKSNGICDWATTHGLADNQFGENGLAIAYDLSGGLAVGGRIYNYSEPLNQLPPSFPVVTPTGAYQQVSGGAFVMLFNSDFTIRWSTAFAGFNGGLGLYDQHTQITDLCFAQTFGITKLWLTGSTYGTGMQYMPWPPPIGTTMYIQDEGNAFLASFDVPTLQLDYSTAWGRDGNSVGYGLDYAGRKIWMVGVSESHMLTAVDCPGPYGPGIHHTYINGSPAAEYMNGGDGFIVALDPESYELKYGTLFGGTKYDCFTDISHDGSKVYITGETRSPSSTGIDSPTSFGADLDPDRYYQPLNDNDFSRDAVILAMDADVDAPLMRWNTAYGGTKSERAWSIASSTAGVYIVGTTSSNEWEDFPLNNFLPGSELDFYQWYNLMGGHSFDWAAFTYLPFYSFEYGLNYLHTYYGEWFAEPENQEYDGFIAYFSSSYHVGIAEPHTGRNNLRVVPLPALGLWTVYFPEAGKWKLNAYNSAGQQVGDWNATGNSLRMDLSERASGVYLLRAVNGMGEQFVGKVALP